MSLKRRLDTLENVSYTVNIIQDVNYQNVKLERNDHGMYSYSYTYYGSSSRSSNIEAFYVDENTKETKFKIFKIEILKDNERILTFECLGEDVYNYRTDSICPQLCDSYIEYNFDKIKIVLKFRNLHRWPNTPTELSNIELFFDNSNKK